MSHQQKLFPRKSEQEEEDEEGEEEEHETCTNLKRHPLREGPNFNIRPYEAIDIVLHYVNAFTIYEFSFNETCSTF